MTDPIHTPRLALLAPEPGHLDALAVVLADPRVMRYVGDGLPRPQAKTAQSLERRIACLLERGVTIRTVLTRVDLPAAGERPAIPAGTVVGDCGVIPIAWQGPGLELLYRFQPDAWGRGLATEAASAAADDAFVKTDADGLIGLVHPENTPSRRVLERCGFTFRGETDRWYGVRLHWLERLRG